MPHKYYYTTLFVSHFLSVCTYMCACVCELAYDAHICVFLLEDIRIFAYSGDLVVFFLLSPLSSGQLPDIMLSIHLFSYTKKILPT